MIAGMDEVGRGAWAGPLVVGTVILGGASIDGLTDSKKLTKKQREVLDKEIRQRALAVGLGWVSARHIDSLGLSAALKLAARRALGHIHHKYNQLIIDGTIALVDDSRVTLMKKADLLVPSVSAASIVAKVARDNYMKHLDTVFKGYKFGQHVGYGTAQHRERIAQQGITPVHRLSYMPLQPYQRGDSLQVKRIFKKSPDKSLPFPSSKDLGDRGELVAEEYLVKMGHAIIARNWRTKYCEIDIVSIEGDTLYFTEVKYRKSDRFGGGVGAITERKQQQMTFAAQLFASVNDFRSVNLQLAVADVSGHPLRVQSFFELG